MKDIVNIPKIIYIAFGTPINLKQINCLSHEKKYFTKSIILWLLSSRRFSIKDYQNIQYLNSGFIKLNDNSNSNYKAREFKKIFVDVKCLFLRIDLVNNYTNSYNPFNHIFLIDT